MQKLLSDQAWSLVLKLNLLWRSGIQYHKLGTFSKPWSELGVPRFLVLLSCCSILLFALIILHEQSIVQPPQ